MNEPAPPSWALSPASSCPHAGKKINSQASAGKRMALSAPHPLHRTQLRKPPWRYQTLSNTYRYSRWKRPAKASSRITVNELEFSSLKTRQALVEAKRASRVAKPFFLGADPWANEGSSQPKDNPLGSQLSSPLWWGQWGRDPLLSEFSVISSTTSLPPSWKLWILGNMNW